MTNSSNSKKYIIVKSNPQALVFDWVHTNKYI